MVAQDKDNLDLVDTVCYDSRFILGQLVGVATLDSGYGIASASTIDPTAKINKETPEVIVVNLGKTTQGSCPGMRVSPRGRLRNAWSTHHRIEFTTATSSS